jgi:sugar lactone lactonase YvrE
LTSLRDRTIKKRKIIIKPKCLCGHIGLFIISGLILAVFVLKSKRKGTTYHILLLFFSTRFFYFYFHLDTKWKQEGITIAGVNSQGNQLNRLSRPRGIFIDDDQNIYVADQGNDRIVEWKSNARNGQIVAGGSGEGNQTNHLDSPKDVIIDKENNLLIICDHGNRRVMRWSRQNKIKNREIIISNIDCYGLAMDKDGSLYVSDNKKHEVRQWKRGDQYGTIVAGGNGQGNHLNQFNSPSFMSIDEDYSLYVSDWSNYRVMKWLQDAKEGIVVAGGNGQGYSLTQLSSPAGVIVDQLGQIYVADWGNHRVMRWCKGAKEGTTVVGGNGQGNQSNQFNHPTSLSFDRQGNLYVVDQGNNRIQKFQIN